MKKKEKNSYFGKDEKLYLIGIPINPHSANLGSKKLTEDPKFIVCMFILAILIIAVIVYLIKF